MTEGPPNPATAPIPAICPETVVCLRCGYNLQSLCTKEKSRGHCPECGAAFDLLEIRRVMATLPPNMTMSDQAYTAPVAAGFVASVVFIILTMLLLDRTDDSNVYIFYGFMIELIALVVFSIWHGRTLAHIDMMNNWRRHARGEVEELQGFRLHRWAFFSLVNGVIAALSFLLSSCCMFPMVP